MAKDEDFSELRLYLEGNNASKELEALDRIEGEVALERELQRLRKIEAAAIALTRMTPYQHGIEDLRRVLMESPPGT